MQSKFIFALASSTVFSLASAQTNTTVAPTEINERAVRDCDQTQLPSLAEGAEWSCRGNSCGISCPEENRFYKNQVFCNENLKWVVTSAIPIKQVTCKRWPREPKFAPECDIDSAPNPGANGQDEGEWNCDKRVRRCKLNCDASTGHNAKTQVICNAQTKQWMVKGKNTCTPPVSRTCDHALANDIFEEGDLNCQRGKSCSLRCNNHMIQGALTCKNGQWEKRHPDMVCCSNRNKPLVENGQWECKDKKFTTICRLKCLNGEKGRTLMKCENNQWNMLGEGTC